jgi:phospholipid/cholesterol/gamma-HCH transport system substrate-binding protein
VLAPPARERSHVSGAIENASEVAAATAERRGDLEADLERLPLFLRELKPTMVRLGALSDEMTPVLTDLGAVAPDINRMILELGPFSRAAIPAFESLGEAADRGTPAVRAALPVVTDLKRLASAARPVGANARRLLASFQRSDGIERLMDYLFFQMAAINGFDSFGHYLRAGLIVNQCANYAVQPTFGCSANYPRSAGASATAANAAVAGRQDQVLRRTAIALARELGLPVPAASKPHRRPAPKPAAPKQARPDPPPAPAPAAPPPAQDRQSQTETLLDYLFGGDG